MNWSYPVANFQRMTFGFAYQDAELLTSQYSSRQALEWVQENGESVPGLQRHSTAPKVKSLDLVAGWQYDSRNAALFPTAGTRLSMGAQRDRSGQRRRVLHRERRLYEVRPLFAGGGCSESTTSCRSAMRSAIRRRYRRSATATAADRAPFAASRKAISGPRDRPRQSVRRQHVVRESVRADHPDAGEDRRLHAHRVVFRRRQRVLDGRRPVLSTSWATLSITTSAMIG